MPKGLRAFPAEVRNMVYRAAGSFEGKAPNLIKALRADRELYDEAMKVFLESNTYILCSENGWGFGDMSEEALAGIKKLEIKIW
jgi:hypothetical protein